MRMNREATVKSRKIEFIWILIFLFSQLSVFSSLGSCQVIDTFSEQLKSVLKDKNITPEMVPLIQGNAEKGDAKSQFLMGCMYFLSKSVNIDHALGLQWMTKAANQGLFPAPNVIGKMYAVATDVPNNYTLYVRA
jgi:TPR repeat protein